MGQTVDGRWRIVRLIGRGGMATVYEAVGPDGVRVALKQLHPILAQSPSARARFLREGRVASAVGHPNAVRVLDTHAAPDGRLYLVMEMLDGQTLRHRCASADGPLATGEVLAIGNKVLEVLAAAHARAIFHRDIKPENIFLTRDGEVKVLDFGIAAVRDEALQEAHLTQSGAALGTPAFMAPEQARGRQAHVDARTDVWAVGATLFQCLTGRHVHEDASNANEALILAATQRAPSLSAFRPDLSGDVVRVIDRALSLEPVERWQSADAMRDAIAQATRAPSGSLRALASADVNDAGDETPSPSSVPGRRRSGVGWRTPVALALALLGGGLAAKALSGGSRPAPTMSSATRHEPSTQPAEPSPTPSLTANEAPVTSASARARPAASAKVVRSAPAPSIGLTPSAIPEEVLDRRK